MHAAQKRTVLPTGEGGKLPFTQFRDNEVKLIAGGREQDAMRVIRAIKWALLLTCLGWAGYSAYFIFEASKVFYKAFPQAGPPEVSGISNLLAGLQLLAVIAGPALLAGALLLIKFPSKGRRSG